MGNQGLYKLYGGVYVRCKSTLCPACEHYQKPILTTENGAGGWANDGICQAQEKLISSANGIGGTCKLFMEHPKAVMVEVDNAVIASIVGKVSPYASIKEDRFHKQSVKWEQVSIAYETHQHFIQVGIVPTRKCFKIWLDTAFAVWQKG